VTSGYRTVGAVTVRIVLPYQVYDSCFPVLLLSGYETTRRRRVWWFFGKI